MPAVLHTIVFNAEAEASEVRQMARQAREVLTQIPGVQGLTFGQAVAREARYRYLLVVTFENEAVIPLYRDHPLHQAFANQVFRPLAPDRITTDYALEEV
ncbi:Dabb family protein [Meiothermus rufus]|uniref:Dabb family protein n=1 Tax=Meiothermus rufus TaxID=604332 RepID=UPI0003FDB15F|nr:Dabb family protein [Meiothermus rufus]